MPGKSSVLSISLPLDLSLDLDSAAKKERRSRSELVSEAVRQYVLLAKWKSLREKAMLRAVEQGAKETDIERLVDGDPFKGCIVFPTWHHAELGLLNTQQIKNRKVGQHREEVNGLNLEYISVPKLNISCQNLLRLSS
jgi:predicted transcriptional regulator